MPAEQPPHITSVMIAAADLEDAEFQRGRLALLCGEAIRQALVAGSTHAEVARAANLSENEVRRLAGTPPIGPAVLEEVALLSAVSLGLPSVAEVVQLVDGPVLAEPAASDLREPDAAF